MIGLLRVLVIAVPATMWYGTKIMWAALRKSPKLECHCQTIPRRWSRVMLRAARAEVVLEHPERIDPDRPQILVANHASWFDIFALAGYLPGEFRFVAKKELEKVPFFGPAWVACGHISIDRGDRSSAIESLGVARKSLEEERPTVVLFPEGTRTLTGALRPFKKGAFVLAIQTGVELIPTAIVGSFDVMRKGSWRISLGRTITVRFGKPIPVAGLGVEDRGRLTHAARDAVQGLLEGPKSEQITEQSESGPAG